MFDLKSIRIGWFLGVRQLRRSSKWTTILIVVIMVLTFLNLVVISGILVGLIEGAVQANKVHFTSDIIISKLKENTTIEKSRQIISTIKNIPGVDSFSPRYVASGTIEANYKERINFNNVPEKVSAIIAGINPQKEDEVTELRDLVIEGEYLQPNDFDQVLVGALLLEKYLKLDSPGFLVLKGVDIGSKLRLEIGGVVREVTVKGITKAKVDEIDRRIFINDFQLKSMMGQSNLNVGEIAIKVKDEIPIENVKNILMSNELDRFANIQTFEEAQPPFLIDVKDTFNLLGIIISSIGLVVAAITVFIVIFINAITRRKYIGIMKAIGVNGKAIELSYVFQSLLYAVVGSTIGLILIYAVMVPYVAKNPINFPFSDGILVAPLDTTIIRVIVLILVTAIAGYVPARIIVSQNTLDSILGR